MSIKYLSSSGLTEVWSNIKAYIASKIPSKIITGLSINGKTITYTNSDGTTGTLTTQDTNTDTKVTQTITTTNAEYPVLFSTDANKTATSTTTARFSSNIKINPNTNTITATTFKGNLSGTATKATQDASGNVITNTYATKSELTTKANDANVVHKSGDETIAGTKTFRGTITFNNKTSFDGTLYFKMTNLESNTTIPTSAQYKYIHIIANDGYQVGSIQFCKREDGSFDTTIYSHGGSSGDSNNGALRITSNNEVFPIRKNIAKLGTSANKWSEVWAKTFNGNLVGNASTATKATQDANGAVISTTYATKAENNTKANDSAVVHNTGAETIDGLKTFNSWQIFNLGLNVKWITGNKEQKSLHLFGSMNDSYQGYGSVLELHGDDGKFGMFTLIAKDKTNTNVKRFVGLPDGTLTWDGKTVLTAGNGVTVDTAQTISGNKTFTGQTTFIGHPLLVKNPTVDLLHSTDSSWVGAGITGADKNNVRIGFFDFFIGTNDCSFKVFCRNRQDVEKEVFYAGINTNGVYGVVDGRHIVRTVNGIGANQEGNVNLTNILGFTPVQQGGGTGQLNNKVYIGWTGSQLKCTVDKTDLGAFVFEGRAQVGTIITAYWGSSSSTGDKWETVGGLNGTKKVSSTTSTFTPVVGQIYSGDQLYSTANPNGGVGYTNEPDRAPKAVYARLNLSGAFNSSYKYLCTTAVGVNATASVYVTGHTASSSAGPYTTITGYKDFTQTLQGGKSTFLRVQ